MAVIQPFIYAVPAGGGYPEGPLRRKVTDIVTRSEQGRGNSPYPGRGVVKFHIHWK